MKFVLLIFFSLYVSAAQSVAISGFEYFSTFSNNNYKSDRGRIALNINQGFGERVRLMSQVDTSYLRIKRLHLDLNYKSYTLRIGRFSRVMGFYNNISDSPATYGMAILPHAPYNEEFLNSSFSTMNGIQLSNVTYDDDYVLYTELSRGQFEMGKDDTIQRALLKGNDLFSVDSPNDNWSVFNKLTYNRNIELLMEFSNYSLNFEQLRNTKDQIEQYLSLLYAGKQVKGNIKRVGGSYLFENDVKITSEVFRMHVENEGNTNGYYIQVDKGLFTDGMMGFAGYTAAKAPCQIYKTCSRSSDLYVGLYKDYKDFFFIAEYHSITGSAWSETHLPNQSSFVLTIGHRF